MTGRQGQPVPAELRSGRVCVVYGHFLENFPLSGGKGSWGVVQLEVRTPGDGTEQQQQRLGKG